MLNHSVEINEIAKALALAGPDLKNPKKGREVDTGSYKYKYAELDTILEQVKPVLAKNNIALIQSAENIPGAIKVTTMLVHQSGQFFSSDLDMPVGSSSRMNSAQATGSAITYGRRYAITAMLGIAAEDDNDAQLVNDDKGTRPAPKTQSQPSQPKIMFIPAKLEERKALLEAAQVTNPDWTAEKLGKYVVTTFKLTSAAQFSHAQCEALLKKFKAKAEEQATKMEQDLKDAVPDEEITPQMVDEGVDPNISGPVLETDSELVKDLKKKNNVKKSGAK